jgi:hypothetical protein
MNGVIFRQSVYIQEISGYLVVHKSTKQTSFSAVSHISLKVGWLVTAKIMRIKDNRQ